MMPTAFHVLFTGLGLLLGLGMSWAAWARPRPRWRLARVVAGWVALASLWTLVYRPAYQALRPGQAAILLTPGYQPDSLRALQRRLPGSQLGQFIPGHIPAPATDTPHVHNLAAWLARYPAAASLHVLGSGLPAGTASEEQLLRLQLLPAPPVQGFTAAQWQPRLPLGQRLSVQGYFHGPTQTPTWVLLDAEGQGQDSVKLAGGTGAFTLHYRPRAAGPALFGLRARTLPGRLLAAEPVPVQVLPPPRLRLLLLSSTPSFEFRFLKNQLAARQHAVALRMGLSRNLYQTEFLHLPPRPLSPLTAARLQEYAVVITDAATLQQMPGREQQTLALAVRQGLGLVVLADVGKLPALLNLPQRFRPVSRSNPTPQPVTGALVPETLPAVLAGYLRPAAGTELLLTTKRQEAVAASARLGLGRLVTSTVVDTYRWLLQNQPGLYETYWSQLLGAAARPAPPLAVHLLTTLPHVNEPTHLRLTAPPTVRQLLAPDGAAVALAPHQEGFLPEWWTATFWPTRSGWYTLANAPDASPYALYVYEPTAWRGPERLAWHRRAAGADSRAGAPQRTRHPEPWHAGWLLALFVLAAGFLWLEEKH